MSRKSRHKKDGVYIQRVESLTDDEWNSSPLFKSIETALKSSVGNNSSNDYRVNVAGADGSLIQHRFREIKWGKDVFKNAFSADLVFEAVKLTFSDGTTDYGFKYWKTDTIVDRKNAILEPIYVRDGIWSEYAGDYVECPGTVISTRNVPLWMLKRLPMYNEKIRDFVRASHGDFVHGSCDRSFEDALYQLMNSDLVSKFAVFGPPPSKNAITSERRAHRIDTAYMKGFNSKIYHAYHVKDQWDEYSYINRDTVDEYGFTPYSTDKPMKVSYIENDDVRKVVEELTKMVVYSYTYLKSIYKDQVTSRKRYGIFAMGSVLNIEKIDYWRNETTKEIWNNLDQTVVGNL